MNIAVAGTGYVGLSMATLLALHYSVTAVYVIPDEDVKYIVECIRDTVTDQIPFF